MSARVLSLTPEPLRDRRGFKRAALHLSSGLERFPKIQHITNLQKTNPEHGEAATGIMGNGPSSAEEHPQN